MSTNYEKWSAAAAIGAVIAVLALWTVAAVVAYHFISKFW